MRDVEQFNRLYFSMSHKYFKDTKSNENKQGFEIQLSSINPLNNKDLNQGISHLWSNLMI